MIFLKGLYVVAIAVVLILLVVMGVEAFYPGPQYPEYNYNPPPVDYNSTEYQEWEQQWEQEWEEAYAVYQQEAAVHDKNMFFVVLPLGVVFALVGTFIQRRLGIFGAGLILGGIGTMIFAIVPGDLDAILRFIGIAATLAVLVFVGYKVFFSLRRT
jgi:hypothetical protein